MPRINNDSEGRLRTLIGSSGIVVALKFADPFAFLCHVVAARGHFLCVLDVSGNYLTDPNSSLVGKVKSFSHFSICSGYRRRVTGPHS
jgi:hypothetical protein